MKVKVPALIKTFLCSVQSASTDWRDARDVERKSREKKYYNRLKPDEFYFASLLQASCETAILSLSPAMCIVRRFRHTKNMILSGKLASF